MPKVPETKTLNASAPQILNAIRTSASTNYQNLVPKADPTQESLRGIGNVIMQYSELKNEFLNALINRIGMVIITSKSYNNPWAMFKRGMLEFGETIEEIFVNLAKPHEYNPEVAEKKVFEREIPDVSAVFHRMNYQKFYKQTINNDQLRQAFLSWDGITDLIARIVDAMYTSMNYDEFLTMKYILALAILQGKLRPVNIGAVSAANMKTIAATIKGVSNTLEFLSTENNEAGVPTYTKKGDQILIASANFDATMDVEVLAAAFNMEKAEFLGNRVLVDSFGTLDFERLNELFENDPTYVQLTETQISALNAIPAVLVDKDWFMIFDNMMQFTEIYNAEGLYWNYFLHVWKTFSHSPYANALSMVTGEPSVTSVVVSPTAATIVPNQGIALKANVTTANFAPQGVTWTSNNANVSVDSNGYVFANDDATGTAIITAVSEYDSTKSATATITIGTVS